MSKLFRNKITQNVINLIVFLICAGIILLGLGVIKGFNSIESNLPKIIEKTWRVQARRTLNDVRDNFNMDVKSGVINPSDELSIQNWSKRNIAGIINGGPTGDIFVINLGNEKFLWDGSPDCARPEFITNGRYMKDESVLHKDKTQAEKMIEMMKLANDTHEGDDYWWNFDGSPEYLEWVVVPAGKLGFGDEPSTNGGIKNLKYSKILIQLGTQKDEVEAPYRYIFENINKLKGCVRILISICSFICVLNMTIYVFFTKNNRV